ncbi:isochorismatase [Exilibacterium tricleocarpae]|uniref:Isochorismatase n=1 Tax=Exilibacterium tricleocarpae TaxID=2591008 RepID=A0A545SXM0_9GAMM|nr:isochorismatase [Exilibacterium tricleocarpae]TQV69704.1 isochorismatase [Exilibacterium tricleocarpae]
MTSKNQRDAVLKAVNAASSTWKSAFNAGDAAGCAIQYEKNASMRAEPFGAFTGREAIQAFWQNLINEGYSEVDYIEPKIEVINSSSAVLKSGWKMNKAGGVIHKELWVIQEDGTAKLREDHFEVV